jgi:hypothetical protein
MNMVPKFVAFAGACGLLASVAMSQPNPTAAENAIGRNNPCADPWVSYAVSVAKSSPGVVGRAVGSGSSHECNPQLYNGGRWSSYAELLGHVRQTIDMLKGQGVRFEPYKGQPGVKLTKPPASSFVSNNSSTFINNDGGSFVSNNSGTFISNDSGSFVSNDGGSFVSNNGGMIVASGYRIQSADGAKFSFKLPGGRAIRFK